MAEREPHGEIMAWDVGRDGGGWLIGLIAAWVIEWMVQPASDGGMYALWLLLVCGGFVVGGFTGSDDVG